MEPNFSPDQKPEPEDTEAPITSQPNTPTVPQPEDMPGQNPEPNTPTSPVSTEFQPQVISPTPSTNTNPSATALNNQLEVPTGTSADSAPAGAVFSSEALQSNPSLDGSKKGSSKKILAIVVGILAGCLLIGGGLAAAYFGIVVPNQPENVLKKAIENTAQQKQITTVGEFEMKAADSKKEDAMPAVKIAFTGKSNAEKKQGEVTLKVTVSGIDFPVEARYVDDAIYVKIGDLSTIASLASGYAASAGVDATTIEPLIKDLSGLLSGQWVEFDSTLLEQAQVSCVVDTNFALTDNDMKLLEDQFQKKSFATIDSHSNDTVDGKSAIKYQISIDDDKLAKFVEDKKMEQLSFMKALKKCPGVENETKDKTSDLADGDITPLTLWVDKDTKLITKFSSQTTKQDAEKSNIQGGTSATLAYGAVSVSKPQNAKPAMQLWGELQQKLTPYFGSLLSGSMTGLDTAQDETQATDTYYLNYITQ